MVGAFHRLSAIGTFKLWDGFATLHARVVGLEVAEARPTAAGSRDRVQCWMMGATVGDAAGERVANRPETVALPANPQRIHGKEFEALEAQQLRVVDAVGAFRFRWSLENEFGGGFGGGFAQFGEYFVGVAFAIAVNGSCACFGNPGFVAGSGHVRRIERWKLPAQ